MKAISRHRSTATADWWAGIAPSLFVVGSLMALLLVPLYVDRRIEVLRAGIESVAEPARTLVAEIQYLLARQSIELGGFLLTGDDAYLVRYTDLARQEQEIYPALEAYAGELSPQVLAQVEELKATSEERRRDFSAAGAEGSDPGAAELRAALGDDISVRVLDAAFDVELDLGDSSIGLRERIRGIEELSRLIYLFLFAVTFAATLAVGTLNVRIRRLVRESNTRRTEAEVALERTERMAEARSDLIRGFTHDVKNPLGAADGYAQLLEAGVRGPLSSPQTETIGAIRRSIKGAIEIIEDLLDLSRLESGGLQIDRAQVDCLHLVRDIVADHAGGAEAAGIDLTIAEWRGQPGDETLYSDAARIGQVLDNLISNGIKYTSSPGRIVVSIQPPGNVEPPKPGRWLVISVSDTGPGIPAEELDRIFHEFHRVPGSRGQGHGLGLAISRRVARLLGGDVTVRSALGEGATFLFWLPVREQVSDIGATAADE